VRVIGIDENGLGPLLGPLVVTGVAFDAPGYDRDGTWSLTGADLPAGDSKRVWVRRRPAAGENAVRRWLALLGAEAGDHAALLGALGLPPPVPAPCAAIPPCCAPVEGTLPRWDAADVALSPGVRDRFDRARIRPAGIRAAVLCPGAFNRALRAGHGNKLRLDCELMLAVLEILAPEDPAEPVLALLGKVGSTRIYGPWLEAAFPGGVETLEESPEISRYRATGRKVDVHFVRDGDALHLPVAVASMIGKYLRELAMHRLAAALGAGDDPPSGYRDRRTRKFVESSAPQRVALGLPDSCFLRAK